MGTLSLIDPLWIKSDGTDRPYSDPTRTDPLRILATVAACYDTADHVLETADPTDPDTLTRDDMARVLAYRVMSTADRLAREPHTWWHGGATTGDTDPVAPAPDPYARVKSDTRPTRTRKGETVDMVKRHGRSYVVGSTVGRPSAACTMSVGALAYALETAPATVGNGRDGIALSRLTAVAYPDLPTLTGADTVAWEEPQTAEPVRAGQYRPVRFPTRYRLATVRPRAGETVRRVTFHDGQTVARLLAPSADPAYVWKGHTLTRRPVTVRAARAARVKRVDRAVTVPPSRVLADALAGEAATAPTVPYRVTFTATVAGETVTGALTLTGSTDRVRYSVTGLPSPVRNYATVGGLRSAVDRAVAPHSVVIHLS